MKFKIYQIIPCNDLEGNLNVQFREIFVFDKTKTFDSQNLALEFINNNKDIFLHKTLSILPYIEIQKEPEMKD